MLSFLQKATFNPRSRPRRFPPPHRSSRRLAPTGARLRVPEPTPLRAEGAGPPAPRGAHSRTPMAPLRSPGAVRRIPDTHNFAGHAWLLFCSLSLFGVPKAVHTRTNLARTNNFMAFNSHHLHGRGNGSPQEISFLFCLRSFYLHQTCVFRKKPIMVDAGIRKLIRKPPLMSFLRSFFLSRHAGLQTPPKRGPIPTAGPILFTAPPSPLLPFPPGGLPPSSSWRRCPSPASRSWRC